MTEAKRGFFPLVSGNEVTVSQAGSLAMFARRDVSLAQGGSRWAGAGNNLSIRQGGALVAGAGNRVSIDRGGSLFAAARNVKVERSVVGLVVGAEIEIGEESTAVFGSTGSLLAGLLLGAAMTGLTRLLRS